MQDEKSSKEERFIMNTKWITKEKIIASPEEHGELEWILLANSTRLSMDTRRYPSGILPFGSMLHFCAFNGNFSQSSGRGICSLTTSWTWFQQQHFSLLPREISYAYTHWISISFLFVFFFHNSFLERTVLSDFSSFWHSVVTIMS